MDLEQHWREARRLRAKRKPVPNSPELNALFREAILEKLRNPRRDLSNAAFAKHLNELGLMTFQGRSWDADSARHYRQALETDIARAGAEMDEEDQKEPRRIKAIRDYALAALARSNTPGQALQELDNDITRLRLDLVEDRNAGMHEVERAVSILELKRASRSA